MVSSVLAGKIQSQEDVDEDIDLDILAEGTSAWRPG